jgi:hypothetical protein
MSVGDLTPTAIPLSCYHKLPVCCRSYKPPRYSEVSKSCNLSSVLTNPYVDIKLLSGTAERDSSRRT